MSKTREISLWVAPQDARDLFGRLTDNTVTFESGGALWVPAEPEQHVIRGCRYTASGTAQQLQQLSAKLINQCLTGGQHLSTNAETAQWLYLNDQDTLFGPFTGAQLSKWQSTGIWTPEFPICHGPSGTWLPLWLVLRLMGLPAANAAVAVSGKATDGDADGMPCGGAAAASVTGHVNNTNVRDVGGIEGTGDWEYGARSSSMQTHYQGQKTCRRSTPAAGSYLAYHKFDSHSANDDGYNDEEMSDWNSEVMAELRRLRQDSAFLQELSIAVDMDWEPQQQQKQQGLQDVMHLTATNLAARSTSWLQQQHNPELVVGGGNSSTGSLLLVIDTNVVLDSRGLPLLQQLQDQQQQQEQQVLVVIPWIVLVELDKLKARPPGPEDAVSVASRARAALRHFYTVMAPGSCWQHMYKAQSIQEFRAASREFDLGLSDKLVVADDRILQCCLSCQQHQRQHQQQQGLSTVKPGVLLLTNDTALRLKAQANSVPVASLRELSILNGGQQQQMQEHLVPVLWRLTADAIPGHNFLSCGTSRLQPAAGAAAAEAQHQQPLAPAAAVHEQLLQARLQRPVDDDVTDHTLALNHITSLRLGLSSQVISIFESEYEQLWLDVVSSRPPWRDTDFLYVLHKHWRSTLQDNLQPAARHSKKQLEVAVQYLIDVNKRLHNRRGSSSSSRGNSRVQPEQLQQNVAVRVIQLLEGFGASAAAARVATAAGLDWEGSLSGATPDRHGNSNHTYNVSYHSTGLSKSGQAMSVRCSEQFSGSRVYAASQVVVQQVQSAEDRAAQHREGSSSVAASAVHKQQNVDCAGPSHGLLGICPTSASPAGSAGITSPRHHVHAIRHGQAHAAAVAAAIPASYGSAADDRPSQQHQQGASSAMQTQQHRWQQDFSGPSQGVQQQQQHMHNSASETPAHHNQQPGTVSWVAAACAAVPAPQLQGPCFRLQQLVEYSSTLVQAATPAVQQMQQMQPAAANEVRSALRQEVQDVVQLLDHVAGMLNMQRQHQHQECLDGIKVNLHEPLLQLGLRLVHLCCCLLADTAAYDTVARQLNAYASAFAADALQYLLQQQQEGFATGLQGLGQLRAAIEQLH